MYVVYSICRFFGSHTIKIIFQKKKKKMCPKKGHINSHYGENMQRSNLSKGP